MWHRGKTMRNINWDIVEQQMKLNKSYRIKWKAYYGMSLTRLIAQLKAQGLSQNQTYERILSLQPDLPSELKRRLQIGIAARFGETATYDSEKKKQCNTQ